MIKALFFLKRKQGITHEQFRDHFENSHVKLAHKHFGHLLLAYHRNYPTQVLAGVRKSRGPVEYEFDCVSEWMLPDERALDAILAMFSDPVIGKEFYDDEEHFLDRTATMLIRCHEGDVVDTGTGDRRHERI